MEKNRLLVSLLLIYLQCSSLQAQSDYSKWTRDDKDGMITGMINRKENYGVSYDEEQQQHDYFTISSQNGLYGIYNTDKKEWYIDPTYDSINAWGNAVKDNRLTNILYGEPIARPPVKKYDGYIFGKNGRQGLVNLDGSVVLPAKYDEILPMREHVFLVRKKKKWGFVSTRFKNSFVAPEYDYIVPDTDPDGYWVIAAYRNKSKKLYSSWGRPWQEWRESKIVPKQKPFQYKRFTNPDRDHWKPKTVFFTVAGRNGVKDTLGNIIIPPKYDKIQPLHNGSYIVSNDTLEGVFDSIGQQVLPVKYAGISTIEGRTDKFITGTFYRHLEYLYAAYENEDTDTGAALFSQSGEQLYPSCIRSVVNSYPVDRNKLEKAYIDIEETKIQELKNEVISFYNDYGEPINDTVTTPIYSHALLLYENGTITKILDNCIAIYSVGYPERNLCYRVYGSSLYGLCNMYTGKIVPPKYKNLIVLKNDKILVSEHDGYYDTILDSGLATEFVSPHKITAWQDSYFIVIRDSGMTVMDSNYRLAAFSYPKLEYMSDPQTWGIPQDVLARNARMFRFYDDKGNAGVIDFDGTIIIPAGKYDDITIGQKMGETSYAYTMPPAVKKYIGKVLVGKKYTGGLANIELMLEGRTIAKFTMPRHWQLEYSNITQNDHLILMGDTFRLYNLTTQKIDLELKNTITADKDGGFTSFEALGRSEYKITKYGSDGRLLSAMALPEGQAHGVERSRPQYIRRIEGKYGLVTINEEVISPFINDTLFTYDDKFYIAERNGKAGIINKDSIIIPFDYDRIAYHPYRNGLNVEKGIFITRLGRKFGALNNGAAMTLPAEYDSLKGEGELIIAKKDGLYHVFDRNLYRLFTSDYDSIYTYRQFFVVTKNGRQGLIDAKGSIMIAPLFERVIPVGDLFLAEDGGIKFLVDASGSRLLKEDIVDIHWTPSYDGRYDENKYYYFLRSANKRYALFDASFKPILPFEDREIGEIAIQKYIIVRKNKLAGVVDMEGKIIVPYAYDDIEYVEPARYFRAEKDNIRYKIAPNGKILEEEKDD